MTNKNNSTQQTGLAALVLQWTQRLAGKRRHSGSGMIPDRKENLPARLPRAFRHTHKVLTTQVRDRDVWIISPIHRDSDDLILYLHGGGYVQNITRDHWKIIREIGIQSGATLVVPDYPLAPEATCPEAFDFLEELYANLFQCREPRNTIFMGDEAGGGLALGFARHLRDRQGKQPSRIILFSPWLDVTRDEPGLRQIYTEKQSAALQELHVSGKAWAGSMDQDDYRVSPLYGDFTGLGAISLFAGKGELFLSDARKLRERLSEQNLSCRYEEFPGRLKDWISSSGRKEARGALQRIGELAAVRFNRVVPARNVQTG